MFIGAWYFRDIASFNPNQLIVVILKSPFYRRRNKLRKIRSFAQGHTVGELQNSAFSDFRPPLLTSVFLGCSPNPVLGLLNVIYSFLYYFLINFLKILLVYFRERESDRGGGRGASRLCTQRQA